MSTEAHQDSRSYTFASGFYGIFVSVVFGFVACIAIQWMVESLVQKSIAWHHWAQFAGVIVVAIHFWLISSASDDIETRFYSMADIGSQPQCFNLFSLSNVVLSLVLACPIVVMAKTCFEDTPIFWRAYFCLTLTSCTYDVLALFLSKKVSSNHEGFDNTKIIAYKRLFKKWGVLDSIILAIAILLWMFRALIPISPWIVAFAFLATTIFALVCDVVFINQDIYATRKE